MKQYFKDYQQQLEKHLAGKKKINWSEICDNHQRQIKYLQHERLIHLLVTLFFSSLSFLIFCLISMANQTNPIIFLLFFILMILTIPYIYHYYFLENTCQQWYRLGDQIKQRVKGKK